MRRQLSRALNDRLFSDPELSERPQPLNQPVRTDACPTDEQLVDHALGMYFLPDDLARHASLCGWCAYVQRLAREESALTQGGLSAWPHEARAAGTTPAGPRWSELEDSEYDEAVVTSADLSSPRGQREMGAGRRQLQESVRELEAPATEPATPQG